MDSPDTVPTSMVSTAALSWLSDWLCGPFVTHAAQKYASTIGTPRHFVEMLFLVEDKRFPLHLGVDAVAIARALIFMSQGGMVQGASTIPQQVYTVRRRRAGRTLRSFGYKCRQMIWALTISAFKDKGTILREYVNSVYWGKSYYGLDEAAKGYLSSTRLALSVVQSFFLAERLANPNRVSVRRIRNLLNRAAINSTLRRNNAAVVDVIKLYDEIYGCGGELCLLLAK